MLPRPLNIVAVKDVIFYIAVLIFSLGLSQLFAQDTLQNRYLSGVNLGNPGLVLINIDATISTNETYPLKLYGSPVCIESGEFSHLEIDSFGFVYDCDSSRVSNGPNIVDLSILDDEWYGVTMYDQFLPDSASIFDSAFIPYFMEFHRFFPLNDCPIDSIYITEVSFDPPGGPDRDPGQTKDIMFTTRIESGGRVTDQNHHWRRVDDPPLSKSDTSFHWLIPENWEIMETPEGLIEFGPGVHIETVPRIYMPEEVIEPLEFKKQ